MMMTMMMMFMVAVNTARYGRALRIKLQVKELPRESNEINFQGSLVSLWWTHCGSLIHCYLFMGLHGLTYKMTVMTCDCGFTTLYIAAKFLSGRTASVAGVGLLCPACFS
jgi:hypothetical protein